MFECPHPVGLHNNTCQWRSEDGANSLKFGMPYDVYVIAENRLDSVNSQIYRARTTMIGMW